MREVKYFCDGCGKELNPMECRRVVVDIQLDQEKLVHADVCTTCIGRFGKAIDDLLPQVVDKSESGGQINRIIDAEISTLRRMKSQLSDQ